MTCSSQPMETGFDDIDMRIAKRVHKNDQPSKLEMHCQNDSAHTFKKVGEDITMKVATWLIAAFFAATLYAEDKVIPGRVVLKIVGMGELRLDDSAYQTRESASMRVKVTVMNGTSQPITVCHCDFKHTLKPVENPKAVIELGTPRSRATVTDAFGNKQEVIIDDEFRIGAYKQVMPRSAYGLDYPIACYQPGIEKGVEYLLTVHGLGQECSTKLKFE